MTKDKWYAKVIEKANSIGLIQGTSNGLFNPDQKITREQIVTILYRLFKYKNAVNTSSEDISFEDANEISGYAKEAVNFASKKEIVKGDGNKFKPKQNATREEAAVMLYRSLKALKEIPNY